MIQRRWRTPITLLLVVGLVAPTFLPVWPRVVRAAASEMVGPARIELTDYRTQYSKRFRNPDGSLTEEVYASSLHFRDAQTGKWREIDTTLGPTGEAPYPYATRSNRFTAHLGATTGQPDLLKITLQGAEVRLTPLGMGRASARVTGNQASFSRPLPDVDLYYSFEPDAVKESIVLQNRAAARDVWRYKVETQGLNPREDSDGTIGLYDSQGSRLLELAHPVIWDDAGATTGATLGLQAEQGVMILTLSIDREWLVAPERRYPVTIDPTISPSRDPFEGQDTFVGSACGSCNYSDRYSLFAGNDTILGRGRTRPLISFNLPGLPSGASISAAALTLTEYSGNLPSAYVDLYRVTSDWSAATVTWNTQPSVGTTRESTEFVTGAGAWNWDVTTLAKDWYEGSQANLGVMLRFADETLQHKEFRSSRWGTVNDRPKLTITYAVNGLGWEKFWGYAGSMNIANGNMVLSATDTAIPARGLSATITRTYNSRSTRTGAFGYGWSSELDMRLAVPTMPDGSPRGPVSYTDLDGTIHYFAQNTNGTYASPPGLYLALSRNGDGTYSVTEKNGLTYKYSSDGKLLSLSDHNANAMTLTYSPTSPSQATTITDAAGRAISLSWANGKVATVTDQAGTVITYTYDSSAGDLTAVTYATGEPDSYTIRYAYDASHNLTALAPPEGNKTYYNYTSDDRLLSVNPINAVVNGSFDVDGDENNLPDFWTQNPSADASATLLSEPAPMFGASISASRQPRPVKAPHMGFTFLRPSL